MKRNWVALAVLLLVLLAGSYVRLVHLGRADFHTDELYQYYVAESIDEGEGPRLPSGQVYTRGIDVTHMVRYSVDLFGSSEWAVRLPNAAMGVLGLLIFAAALWAIGGPWVAVWGTLFLSIYPDAITESRALRFYTFQLVFGLIALYTGWRALASAGSREPADRTMVIRQWLWMAATLVAFLIAARAQVTTYSVAAGWGLCVALAAAADMIARGWRAWRRSVPLQLTALGIAGAALVLLARPGLVERLWARSQSVPRWALFHEGTLHPLSYYYSLSDNFPILVSLLPLIFLAAILRKPRLGMYLAVWFAVPMFLHSFVFAWKGGRFVLLAMPALYAAAGIAAAWGASALYTLVKGAVARAGLNPRFRNPAAYTAVAIVSLALIVTTPAFNDALEVPFSEPTPTGQRWTTTAGIIRSNPELLDVPTGHTAALRALYYWPRLDFVIRINGLERDTYQTEDGTWKVEYYPMGTPEYKAGRPVLTTPGAIREHFAQAGSVLLGYDVGSVENDNIDPRLIERLRTEAEELCQGRCGTMRLYHWRFDSADTLARADTLAASAGGGF